MTDEKNESVAVCLYNQPFGFTREDVRALDWLDGHGHNLNDESQAIGDGYANDAWQSDELRAALARLRGIRAHIAALLPPEEAA